MHFTWWASFFFSRDTRKKVPDLTGMQWSEKDQLHFLFLAFCLSLSLSPFSPSFSLLDAMRIWSLSCRHFHLKGLFAFYNRKYSDMKSFFALNRFDIFPSSVLDIFHRDRFLLLLSPYLCMTHIRSCTLAPSQGRIILASISFARIASRSSSSPLPDALSDLRKARKKGKMCRTMFTGKQGL